MGDAPRSAGRVAWSWTKWGGQKVFNGMWYLGETFASILGLYNSKYQDVLDEYLRIKQKEMEEANRKLAEEQAKLAQKDREASEMEGGDAPRTRSASAGGVGVEMREGPGAPSASPIQLQLRSAADGGAGVAV
eukprot:tig00000142_g8646.t1